MSKGYYLQTEKVETGKPEKKPADLDPYNPSKLLVAIFPFKKEIDLMTKQARAIVVNDDKALAKSVAMEGQAKQIKKRLTKAETDILKPADNARKTVKGKVRPLTNSLDDIIRTLVNGRRAFVQKKEQDRLAAERKAQAQANEAVERQKKALETVARTGSIDEIPAAPAVVIPEVVGDSTVVKTESGSLQTGYKYTAVLSNPRELDEECFKSRWKQIADAVQPYANAMLKIGKTSIPGFTVTKELDIKTRVLNG